MAIPLRGIRTSRESPTIQPIGAALAAHTRTAAASSIGRRERGRVNWTCMRSEPTTPPKRMPQRNKGRLSSR